ncbi:Tol-Pal system protein TolB [Allosphingosinicella flava]|uniref:Tol-Pal system protein TolB n=1 Tax=Allosphingosinicella flava TaxID=2771430 RepID=A0A7T2GIY8_9SPHN|nr:Tol-Pal system beta propeller repeat protein TolB [Sphingosinicella flava]QPQ54735.1 Tol-Pal system protein TolB [Sphingosinicella flava]
MKRLTLASLLAATILIAPAAAQEAEQAPPASATAQEEPPPLEVDVVGGISAPMPIAVPYMPTPASATTAAGETGALGRQVAEIVASDLRNSGIFTPRGPAGLPAISYPQVTAPDFGYWGGTGAQALVQGFVQANGNGTLTVGCYLYDVYAKKELTRQGYVVEPRDWRRAAHKCADAIYSRLSGESPFFDSRIAYIAESGPKDKRVKRLAIMDSDGANHRFLTNGQSTVMTPRFSPDYKQIVYLSYIGERPRIYIYDIGTGRQRLVTESANQTFSPRFSPDGRWILYSMSVNGNTDLYRISANGGQPMRLTNAPGIDTAGSYSPDGSKIVFESDRSGGQQLYVMNADGSDQRRISFGGGRYATPEWSPRGDLIAYTKIAGNFRIGVMSPSGGGEKLLTNSWQDEAPSWSPNGRIIQFFRTSQGRSGKSTVWQVDLTGSHERQIPTPLDGSDPAWGPLLP